MSHLYLSSIDKLKDYTVLLAVTFIDERKYPDETLGLPQIIASMIFYGYLAINSVVQHILSPSSNNDQTDEDLFSSIQKYLTNMYPLRFRLEILENIFSLIFIQQNELKLKHDEQVDIIEQSANTASTSLSTSEKFFASLHSNLAAESINTSTNVSIRTQMSSRRVDKELEINTDESASVCSSSVSSVSVSQHHSLHRSGYLIDQEYLQKLLMFLQDQVTEVKTLNQKIRDKAIDRNTREYEELLDQSFHGCSIKTPEQLSEKISKLGKTISQALWRYQIITTDKAATEKRENSIDGQDSDDNLVYNHSVKNLILPTRKQ